MKRAAAQALIGALAVVACTAAAVAQQQQPPVFRSATQFVAVDVVVTGKDDLAVTDLKREDFEITENGKPQKISEFSYVSIPVAHRAVDVDAPPQPSSDVATNGDSGRASRAIVIFVDDPSLSAVMFCETCPDVMVALKNALTRFLQSLDSNDQVAIIWQSRSDISQDFTNDIPRLIASVNSRKAGMGLTPIGPIWRPTVHSLNFAINALAGSNFARRSIVYVGASACNPTDHSTFQGVECRAMYDRAKNANVPIYALDPRVLPESGTGIGTMAELALNTGGLHFTRQSDPLGAVDKIVLDNGSFYTLGFYPEPLVTDGKYHEIKVNVKRDGVRVRSRERYLADAAAKPASSPARDMTASLGAGRDDPSLPVRVTAVPLAAGARGLVRTLVTLEVAYPAGNGNDLSFDDDLRVGILALSTDGKVKASFQRPIELKGKWKPGARGLFVINETIDLPDDQLALRVGVTSRVLGRTGTAHLPIKVPNFRETDLNLSPIVLGVAGQVTNADAAVGLDRVRDLVPFQPTTSRAFTPADSLRLFLTGAWRSSTTALNVEISITGGPQPVIRQLTANAGVAAGGGRRANIDTVVPLRGLAPGAYVLSVTAIAGKGKPVTRAIPFAIKSPQ